MPFRLLMILLLLALNACATTKSAPVKCHVYLLVPPYHEDERLADAVAESWLKEAKAGLKGCHRFVPYESGKEALTYINLDHATETGERRRSTTAWESVQERTGATRAIELQLKIDGQSLDTSVAVFDLPEHRVVVKHPLPKKHHVDLQEAQVRRLKNAPLRNFLVHLVPNTVTLGFSSNTLYNDRADSTQEEYAYAQVEEHQKGLLPPILSAFGFSHIQHPDGFGTFDYDTSIYGNLSFFYLNTSYVYARLGENGERTSPEETFTYDLQVLSMAPTVNAEVSFFWPLGTTFLGLGLGPALNSVQDSLGKDETFASLATRLTVGHRAFFNDRWYMLFAVETLQSDPPLVVNEVFKSSNTSYATFAVGYFFPQSRSLANRIF